MSFVKIPNLPDNRISLAAVGNYPEIIAALHKLNIRTLSLENGSLPPETARHQDMLLCHTGESSIFLDPSQDGRPFENEGFRVSYCASLGSCYPEDVRLNVAVSEKYFIYNPKTADPALIAELEATVKNGIAVKQGYSKCSVCFITEKAIITEDRAIALALESTDTDTLLISKGDIYLSDEHYGFLGGSAGKIDRSTLAVTGSLSTHRDGEKIKSFCRKHSVSVLELTTGRITDVGGILPLKS